MLGSNSALKFSVSVLVVFASVLNPGMLLLLPASVVTGAWKVGDTGDVCRLNPAIPSGMVTMGVCAPVENTGKLVVEVAYKLLPATEELLDRVVEATLVVAFSVVGGVAAGAFGL